MTNQNIDNGAATEFGRVILWQYDQAGHLISMISMMQSFFNDATKYLWDLFKDTVLNVSVATDFGLCILGSLAGVARPYITVGGTSSQISTNLYRKYVRARFVISNSDYSVDAINEFLKDVYGQTGGVNNVKCVDNFNMTISFTVTRANLTAEQLYLIDNMPDYAYPFPAAVHDTRTFEEIRFALTETQPASPSSVSMNGIACGGLDEGMLYEPNDDTAFIPEEERVI